MRKVLYRHQIHPQVVPTLENKIVECKMKRARAQDKKKKLHAKKQRSKANITWNGHRATCEENSAEESDNAKEGRKGMDRTKVGD